MSLFNESYIYRTQMVLIDRALSYLDSRTYGGLNYYTRLVTSEVVDIIVEHLIDEVKEHMDAQYDKFREAVLT